MREETETIRNHYDENPRKEWDRLQKRFPHEKYVTTRMMDRYIKPGDTILDIGGGPGQYSIHYARKGHDVTLLDLSGENVCFAKKKARQYGVKITAVEGNALDLSRFPDNTFDIVFLMGPLYHLMNGENRLQALREAARVLKPGGTLFSSFILLFGAVIYGLREIPETIFRPKEQRMFDVASREESLAIEAFTYAYMTTVKEAKALAASVPGLKTKTVFGQESILSPYKNVLDRYPRKIRTAWYDYALRFCEKEEYLNHSDHLMIVSEKEL